MQIRVSIKIKKLKFLSAYKCGEGFPIIDNEISKIQLDTFSFNTEISE